MFGVCAESITIGADVGIVVLAYQPQDVGHFAFFRDRTHGCRRGGQAKRS